MCLAAMEMCCSDLSLRENLSWGMLLRQVPLQSASALKPIKQCPGSLGHHWAHQGQGPITSPLSAIWAPRYSTQASLLFLPVGCQTSITVWSLSALFLFRWSYLQQISWTLNSVLGICFWGTQLAHCAKISCLFRGLPIIYHWRAFPLCFFLFPDKDNLGLPR